MNPPTKKTIKNIKINASINIKKVSRNDFSILFDPDFLLVFVGDNSLINWFYLWFHKS